MTIADEVRENQAARIRWLLERVPHDVYWEFTMKYVVEHPFPADDEAEVAP
jgi:hypothetical protein